MHARTYSEHNDAHTTRIGTIRLGARTLQLLGENGYASTALRIGEAAALRDLPLSNQVYAYAYVYACACAYVCERESERA